LFCIELILSPLFYYRSDWFLGLSLDWKHTRLTHFSAFEKSYPRLIFTKNHVTTVFVFLAKRRDTAHRVGISGKLFSVHNKQATSSFDIFTRNARGKIHFSHTSTHCCYVFKLHNFFAQICQHFDPVCQTKVNERIYKRDFE